jgi:hypothetical protein
MDKKTEQELKNLAQSENKSESTIIREAIVAYIASKKPKGNSYKEGAKLFGAVASGDGTGSVSYKSKLKSKIREKAAR